VRHAEVGPDERLEPGSRRTCTELGECAAYQAEVDGADDVAVLTGELEERAGTHEYSSPPSLACELSREARLFKDREKSSD
jgi:hypothetical protein